VCVRACVCVCACVHACLYADIAYKRGKHPLPDVSVSTRSKEEYAAAAQSSCPYTNPKSISGGNCNGALLKP
jgi:hypothetical protein